MLKYTLSIDRCVILVYLYSIKKQKQFTMKTLNTIFDVARLAIFFFGSLAVLVMYGILMLTIF